MNRPIFICGTLLSYGAYLAGLSVFIMFYFMPGLIVYRSIGGQYLIGRTCVGILCFIVLEIDHWVKAIVLR